MEHHHCLNCNQAATDTFCGHCGQKISTHRYSIKHFLEHDIVHGIWHVDKGIFYTIKELFTRPGHSIREYVEGKRAKHFNFISLLIIGLAISSFLKVYTKIEMLDLVSESSREAMGAIEKFTTKYPKLTMAIYIPINAMFSFFWFRKAKYNYSEHLVLNSYKSVGDMVVGLAFTTLTIFYTNIKVLSFIYMTVIAFFGLFYAIWFYRQFFSHSGLTKKALIWRSILAAFSPLLLSFFIGIAGAIWGFYQGYSQNIGK